MTNIKYSVTNSYNQPIIKRHFDNTNRKLRLCKNETQVFCALGFTIYGVILILYDIVHCVLYSIHYKTSVIVQYLIPFVNKVQVRQTNVNIFLSFFMEILNRNWWIVVLLWLYRRTVQYYLSLTI